MDRTDASTLTSVPAGEGQKPTQIRRRYESPLRRQQVLETRERIVLAGSALAHGLPTWDWRDLTFRAVAVQAGVSERTVYRYFSSERELHEAIMARLEQEAGVSYEGISLDEIALVAARVFAALSAFAVPAGESEDPTFAAEDQRRQEALLHAVANATEGWSKRDQTAAAALLDVLWAIPSYLRLTTNWHLDADEAMRATEWAIRLLIGGIQSDRRPQVGRRR